MPYKNFRLAPAAGLFLLSGFIILFPFFSIKAQKAKKDQSRPDSSRNKTLVVNSTDPGKALVELERLNLDSIGYSASAALAAVDFEAIGRSVTAALQAVNADSIRRQVDAALHSVNMQQVQVEVDRAMVELKKSNWQQEMQNGLKEMQAGLKEIEKVNMADIRKELEAAQQEIATAQVNLKTEMTRVKGEITQLKNLLAEMKKDGLIEDGGNVKLEWKNEQLYINGKKQSAAVSEKYKALQHMSILVEDDASKERNEL